MSIEQVQHWLDMFGELGYIVGFLLPFIEAFLPILPIIVFVIVNVNAYGLVVGILLSWAGTVIGSYLVFLFFRRITHTSYMMRVQQRKSVVKLIQYVDRRGFVPIFILLCFPFTPSALINVVASLSHIRAHMYLVILCISKLVMITMVGVMGNDITTLITNPTRAIILLVVVAIVWFVSRFVEKHFMHNEEE